MAITDSLILPADLILVPVEELSQEMREQVTYEAGDVAITRLGARTPSKIIDTDAAELLSIFKQPHTIVEAVVAYSRAHLANPEETLVDAYPMLRGFMTANFLVPANSDEAAIITPRFDSGTRVLDWQIVRCIQALEDTELYLVRKAQGHFAALKILRPSCSPSAQRLFDREALILQHLDGTISPDLIDSGLFEGRPYLLATWCPGIDAAQAAAEARAISDRRSILQLGCAILDTYVQLHAQKVLHSDIHPRNVLIDKAAAVKLIDFGFARVDIQESEFAHTERVGIGFFYEPEYACAFLARRRPPLSSNLGEQYALAVLLYYLFTGKYYLNFSLELDVMMRQIAQDEMLPFTEQGTEPWPAVEQILARALSKEPANRFPSVADFACALRLVAACADNASPDNASADSPRLTIDSTEQRVLLSDVLAVVDPNGTLFIQGVPNPPKSSVNFGAAGIAYALYRMATVRDDPALLSAADLWITKALRESTTDDAFYNAEMEITPDTVGSVSPYHTRSGLYAVQALIAQAMGDTFTQQMAMEAFMAESNKSCDNLDLTLGRSSTLLVAGLLLDASHTNDLLDATSVWTLGNGILHDIWTALDTYGPIATQHQITYLGIAHGWSGILYATLRWCQSARAELPLHLVERLHQLADLAEPIGRGVHWPWMLDQNHAQNYMPGWCNGSAGQVFLWLLAHEMLGNAAYLRLAERAAWNAWEDPAVATNLCCGLAGRAYSLLKFYKYTGDVDWLLRAQILGKRGAVAIQDPEMPQESLYKGQIGLALLTADLERPQFAQFPFFEEAGWKYDSGKWGHHRIEPQSKAQEAV